MKTIVLFILCVVGLQPHLHAQAVADDPIQKEYETCIGTDTSVANTSNCVFKAYAKYNEQMEYYYKKLIREVKNDTAKKIAEKSQHAWLTWRDTEFGTYNCIFDKEGNKWIRVRAEGRLNMMRARAYQLKAYYQVLRGTK